MSQEQIPKTPESQKKSHFRFLMALILAILLGSALGGWFPTIGAKTILLGDIFMNALKMVVVPLVIFSMIVGITSLGDVRHMGAIGKRTAVYFLSTTLIAVILGILLVNLIQPGKGILHGEEHPDWSYRIEGEQQRTLTLVSGSWLKTNYNSNY
ncbi:MAG: cation:dicarboxylase symporter family transporter, partial [Planctomycetota bacterium]